jgi:hypothetical protein
MYPQSKADLFLDTTSVTNGGTATANLDTIGFDFVSIDLISTTASAGTVNPSVLKLSESDDTVATNFADITALVGDGTGGFTIPSWFTQTADRQVLKFNIDLRHRKRYLRLTVSPTTTQSFTALANLHRGELAPVNATDANVLALVSA